MKLERVCASLLLAGMVAVAPLYGQADSYGRGGVAVEPYAGVLNVERAEGTNAFVDNDILFGGRLSYVFPSGFFISGEGSFLPGHVVQFGQDISDIDITTYGGALGYAAQLAPNLQLLSVAGVGQLKFDPAGIPSATDLQINFGTGVRLFVSPNVAFRVDGRTYLVPDSPELDAARAALFPGATIDGGTTRFVAWSAGLSFFFGGSRDADGDGVTDDLDLCPDTPRGASVDANGCPIDTDGDGVADYVDDCPDTPAGASVDDDGCPMDTDGDGVFDGLDQCPDTPAGARVDSSGCPTDADGDGVFDGLDQCPDTPAGASVDENGCPSDTDGDGVLDGIDRCPSTPSGASVDENGCTVIEAGIEQGRLVLQGIEFEFNRADIRDTSKPTLDEVAAALVGRPNLQVEIRGYTDSTGGANYNQSLSERRAESVMAYLLESAPQLDASRFSARGYGEVDPVATNDTEEGRSQNRRVEFHITGQ
ncbi:MAG: OmpA family protein [Gemmatimonadota bacterium]